MAGRPTTFKRELFDTICDRIAHGETLREICRETGMPPEPTVRNWVTHDYEGIAAQYARARELQLDTWADEMMAIADDGSNDWMERHRKDGSIEVVLDREHVERSRQRVDTRKWLLARLARNVYGEQTTLRHEGDVTQRHLIADHQPTVDEWLKKKGIKDKEKP